MQTIKNSVIQNTSRVKLLKSIDNAIMEIQNCALINQKTSKTKKNTNGKCYTKTRMVFKF